MGGWSRRGWLASVATASMGAISTRAAESHRAHEMTKTTADEKPLALVDYEPKSMLHVPETQVPRSRFPVIDFHTHLSWVEDRTKDAKLQHTAKPDEVLPVMDRKNVRMMINLTGGYGTMLDEAIAYWQTPHPDRFIVFTEPWYNKIIEPGYASFQAEQIEQASRSGAKGLKILKTLGLYLTRAGDGREAREDRRPAV